MANVKYAIFGHLAASGFRRINIAGSRISMLIAVSNPLENIKLSCLGWSKMHTRPYTTWGFMYLYDKSLNPKILIFIS